MKKKTCQKCKKYNWVEKHHILPQCNFPKGKIIYLCPNCHTDFHRQFRDENLKNISIEFHYEKFFRWLVGLSISLILLLLSLN